METPKLTAPAPPDPTFHLLLAERAASLRPTAGTCVVCHKAERLDLTLTICERCGAPHHSGCYWLRVATKSEQRRVHTLSLRKLAAGHVPVICRGCRS